MTSIVYALELSKAVTVQITHRASDNSIVEESFTGSSWTATGSLTPSPNGQNRAYFTVVFPGVDHVILTGTMSMVRGDGFTVDKFIDTAPERFFEDNPGGAPLEQVGPVWQPDYTIYCRY